MSHIEDLWYKDEEDPVTGKIRKVKKPGHGKGMRYKVRWIDPGGNERSRSFPDKKKREAEAFQTSIDHSLLAQSYMDPRAGERPFRVVAYEWLKGTSADPSSRDTRKRQMEHHILPFFESHSIKRAATTEAVKDWLEWLNKRKGVKGSRTLDPAYQRQLFDMLSCIFAHAFQERLITGNPCKSKGVTAPKPPARKIVPWSRAKLDAIHKAIPPRYQIAVPLGVGLGLRRGEILAVDVSEDINRADRVIHVQRQIRRLPDGVLVFSLPKGNKSRFIPVAKSVLTAIDDYQEEFAPVRVTLPWRVEGGTPTTFELLMVRDNGDPLYGEYFQRTAWAPAFDVAGVTRRPRIDGPHQLRHLYASAQLAAGVSVKELAEYLGHADAKVTLNTYAHLMPSSYVRSRAATDAFFAGVDPETAQGRLEDEPPEVGEGGDPVELDDV
ncbi:site-specific integrase [Nocardia cyriacigeorgica]|uniref:tyrosine-type recombinase/integrase n=1 Tax=Nocardia cyriacigeorgica TaxID=135487 RepID=UPI001893F32F|nr:site-specific integrase [Nocardia cyriacigeorgica]MBF6326612.1 site-specific integrase [Nocardia cyriacigeorgica]